MTRLEAAEREVVRAAIEQPEEWRPIPGYEGRYDVSNRGAVRTWMVGPGRRRAEPKPLAVYRHQSGYLAVTLWNGNKQRTGRINRLVLLAFVGPPPHPHWHAAHLNNVRDDNRLENLQWKSPQENVDDKVLHGTQTAGESHPQTFITSLQVRAIRELHRAGWSNRAIAALFKRPYATIRGITSANDRVTAAEDFA